MCNLFTAEGKIRISLDYDVLVPTCVIISSSCYESEVGRFSLGHASSGKKLELIAVQRAGGMRKDIVDHC
jgi:hypothetical protein